MPMKMPFGPHWFRGIKWNMPNLFMAGVPGFEKVTTGLINKRINKMVSQALETYAMPVSNPVLS